MTPRPGSALPPPWRRRLRSWGFSTVFGGTQRFLGGLSWSQAQALGRTFGRLGWRLKGRDRQRTREHLAIAFPELDPAAREALGQACFAHLGACLGELLHLVRHPVAAACERVEVCGWDAVAAVREGGRPLVLLTAHCGNWELLSTANFSHQLGLRALARQLEDPVLGAALIGLRQHWGTETICRGSKSASCELRRALRSHGALGLLIDQDIRTEGVWVPFFGRPAHTPLAAAHLALRLGAAVVPAFTHRRADGNHELHFLPALELPPCPTTATAMMTSVIEAQIRRHPEQWVWMHRRWRRAPPEVASSAT